MRTLSKGPVRFLLKKTAARGESGLDVGSGGSDASVAAIDIALKPPDVLNPEINSVVALSSDGHLMKCKGPLKHDRFRNWPDADP